MNPTKIIRIVVAAVLVSLATVPLANPKAQAQNEDADRKLFNELMQKAAAAREAGNHGEALEALLKAYNLYPNPTLLFNIGKLYQDKSECENAMTYFLKAHEGLADSQDANAVSVKEALRKELAGFECVGDEEKTRVVLSEALQQLPVADALVKLGDLSVKSGNCKDARSAYLKATEVAETGSEAGNRAVDALKDFKCDEGGGDVAAVTDPGGGDEKEPQVQSDTPAMVYVAWSLLALSGASLVGGILVDLDTLGTIDDYEKAADAGRKAEYDSLKKDAESGQTTTLILYIASGVLAAGGVTTWLLADDGSESSADLRVLPTMSPNGDVGVAVQIPFF